MGTAKPNLPRLSPTWSITVAGIIRLVIFYGIVPWALSRVGARYGWSEGMPSLLNILGLVITGGGVLVLLWCTSLHINSFSKPSPIESYPPLLLVGGPYRVSRNPMYIADLAMWLGWAFFYGSIPVLLATLCFGGILALVSVPAEERQLLARFGDEYQLYKSSVPRWIGRQPVPRIPAA